MKDWNCLKHISHPFGINKNKQIGVVGVMEKEKRTNIVKCHNKLCALYSANEPLHCLSHTLGLTDMEIRQCNTKVLYHEYIRRENHDKWIEKKRMEWNLYQKAYRNKNKNEIQNVT